jgi:hypothetical protein
MLVYDDCEGRPKMNARGILFTLGVATVGGVLFTFAFAHSMQVKPSSSEPAAICIQKVSSLNSNIAAVTRRVFLEASGIGIMQSTNALTISGKAPANRSAYMERMRSLAYFSGKMLNATVEVGDAPEVESTLGASYKQVSDDEVIFELPDGTSEIAIDVSVEGNASGYNLSSAPGRTWLGISVECFPGGFRTARDIDIQSETTLTSEAFTMMISGGTMRLRWLAPSNYTITVRVNETRRPSGMALPGRILTHSTCASREGVISL